MPEKKFILSANQHIWDDYYTILLVEWATENSARLYNTTYSLKKEQQCLKRLPSYNKKTITPYEFEFIIKKQTIQQYKPIVMSFERFVNKSFNDVSSSDLENFKKTTSQKCRLTHLNAFLLKCVSRKIIITSDVDFMVSLLPVVYRKLGKIISETS